MPVQVPLDVWAKDKPGDAFSRRCRVECFATAFGRQGTALEIAIQLKVSLATRTVEVRLGSEVLVRLSP
jgi:hypothetical protein